MVLAQHLSFGCSQVMAGTVGRWNSGLRIPSVPVVRSVGRLGLPPSVEAQSGQGASAAAQSSKWVSQESQVEEALYEVTEWHVCHSHKPTQIPGEDTQIPSLDGNSVRVTSWAGHVRWEVMFQLTWGDPLWLRWGAGVNR